MINQEKYQAWHYKYPPAFELMKRNFNSNLFLIASDRPIAKEAADNLSHGKMPRKGIERLVEANLKQNDKQA